MSCVRAWCSRPPAAPSVVPAALFEGHIQAGFFRLIAPLSSWKMFLSAFIGFVKHVRVCGGHAGSLPGLCDPSCCLRSLASLPPSFHFPPPSAGHAFHHPGAFVRRMTQLGLCFP